MKSPLLPVVALIAISASGCVSESTKLDPRAAALVGEYGLWVSHIEMLQLRPDGQYFCSIWSDFSQECLNVIGSGSSYGAWDFQNGTVRFFPTRETADLIFSLEGAYAISTDDEMHINIAGKEYRLSRQATWSHMYNPAE